MTRNKEFSIVRQSGVLLKNYWVVPLSSLFSLWLIGPRNISPSRYEWLWFGDLRAAQIQWEFFRATALFQFPIAGTPNYVRAEPHSLLFLFPFKLINPILPDNFQFMGFVVLVLFTLQAVAAQKLLGLFGLTTFQKNVASCFFVISPLLIFRTATMSHVMLGGHFLILASIYLYWAGSNSIRNWTLVCLTLSFLDPYLLVVSLSVLGAHVCRESLQSPRKTLRMMQIAATVIVLVAASLGLQGYFSDPSSLQSSFSFRLNLAAFINPHFGPNQNFSVLMPHIGRVFDQSNIAEEQEGFGFVGFGVIVGAFFSAIWFSRNSQKEDLKRAFPLVGVSLLWLYVALSSEVALFRKQFNIPYPDFFDSFRSMFRGTPRFTVLLYYLILLFVVVGVSRIGKRYALLSVVLPLLVAIQIFDSYPGIMHAHEQISSEKIIVGGRDGARLEEIGDSIKHLYVYPTYDFNSDYNSKMADYWIKDDRWYPLVMYAARNGVTSNFGYLARGDLKTTRAENSRVYRELTTGRLMPCSVYAVPGEAVWSSLKSSSILEDRAIFVDGYYLFLGPLGNC